MPELPPLLLRGGSLIFDANKNQLKSILLFPKISHLLLVWDLILVHLYVDLVYH